MHPNSNSSPLISSNSRIGLEVMFNRDAVTRAGIFKYASNHPKAFAEAIRLITMASVLKEE